MNKLVFGAIALILVQPVFAEIQISILDGQGRNSLVSSDGELARIEEKGAPGWALVNPAANTVEMYDPNSNQVLIANMGKGGATVTGSDGVQVGLISKGGGPVIAGYSTKKFDYTANGQSCGTIYGSQKLFKHPAVRSLFDSMRAMQAQSRRMMQGMGGSFMDACEQASLFLSDSMEKVGAPMRVTDRNGRLLSEVAEVKTGVNFPAGHFQMPANAERVDMQQQMQEAMQGTNEMMQGMEIPDMNAIMQQMEQSGMEIPEEAMEQMQQLQKQLQQMQQQ